MAYNPERTKQETLSALHEYYAKHGESPTYQELGDMLGVSQVAAHNRVRKLVNEGKVEILDRMWRNILLVDYTDLKL